MVSYEHEDNLRALSILPRSGGYGCGNPRRRELVFEFEVIEISDESRCAGWVPAVCEAGEESAPTDALEGQRRGLGEPNNEEAMNAENAIVNSIYLC